jgi:hypothetical protein
MIHLRDLRIGTRFLRTLPGFLRHPLSPAEARSIVATAQRGREEALLGMAREAIFASHASPYRRLCNAAGCEYGDVEALVRTEGVEGALEALYRRGVYLTVDEFKGRRPAKRGSATIDIDPDHLRNPRSVFHVPVRSGGSRSQGSPVLMDLAFIRDCAARTRLMLAARGGEHWVTADWEVPGGGAMFRLLKFAALGAPPQRWFSHVDPGAPGLHPRYRWSAQAMHVGSRLSGVPLPAPIHAPLDRARVIAEWLAAIRRDGRVPHLITFPSSAARLCQTAVEANIDIRGTELTVSGEPITAARLAVIARAGAHALPRYGSIECGPIAYGCLSPQAPDDVHWIQDMHGLIQSDGRLGDPLPAGAILITALSPSAPFVLFNVSMGDRCTRVSRSCGCPMDGLGWPVHLRDIRSFEKLTAAGMTFMDTDVIRVLEEVLPAKFGGAPPDYQLVETEGLDGQPRLLLLVHPRLGLLDEQAIANAFLAAIGTGSGVERMIQHVWRDGDVVRVERRPPESTTSGKISHLHVSPRR